MNKELLNSNLERDLNDLKELNKFDLRTASKEDLLSAIRFCNNYVEDPMIKFNDNEEISKKWDYFNNQRNKLLNQIEKKLTNEELKILSYFLNQVKFKD